MKCLACCVLLLVILQIYQCNASEAFWRKIFGIPEPEYQQPIYVPIPMQGAPPPSINFMNSMPNPFQAQNPFQARNPYQAQNRFQAQNPFQARNPYQFQYPYPSPQNPYRFQ